MPQFHHHRRQSCPNICFVGPDSLHPMRSLGMFLKTCSTRSSVVPPVSVVGRRNASEMAVMAIFDVASTAALLHAWWLLSTWEGHSTAYIPCGLSSITPTPAPVDPLLPVASVKYLMRLEIRSTGYFLFFQGRIHGLDLQGDLQGKLFSGITWDRYLVYWFFPSYHALRYY